MAQSEVRDGTTRGATIEITVDVDDPLHTFTPDLLDENLTSHHVTPESELGATAEQFVYDVYRVSGFCRESARRVVEETEPWRPGSALHVVCDGPDVLGVVRTLLGPYEALPIGQFEPQQPPPDGQLCEVASLAVKPDRRGMGVANDLHRMVFEFGVRNHVQGFCFLVDEWMSQFFQDYYAFPVRPMGPVQPYMGGDVLPIVVRMDELLVDFPTRRPFVYQVATSGFSPQEIVDFDLPIVLT